MKFWQKQKCRHSVVLLLLLATTTIATATMAPIMWMSLSVSADTMSNLCVKTIVEHGSRLDRLIYGVGALVHHAVCFEQKRGRFRVCPTRHYCHVIVSSLLVISIVVVVVVVVELSSSSLSSSSSSYRCHRQCSTCQKGAGCQWRGLKDRERRVLCSVYTKTCRRPGAMVKTSNDCDFDWNYTANYNVTLLGKLFTPLCLHVAPGKLRGWLRGAVLERCPLTGERSLSCARPTADGWPLMWVNRPLWVSQPGQLSLSSFRGR